MKFFAGVNAAGETFPGVSIVTDKTIRDGEVYEVYSDAAPGMGTSVRAGLILVARTRTDKKIGPRALRHFVVEFGAYLESIGYEPRDDGAQQPVMWIDGADENLRCLEDPVVAQTCKARSIILAKSPASATQDFQALGVSSSFLSTKASNRKLASSAERVTGTTPSDLHKAAARELERALSEAGNRFTGQALRKVVNTLLRMRLAVDDGLTKSKVMGGFAATHVHPLNTHAMIARHYGKFPELREMEIEAMLEQLAAAVAKNGIITEKDFDEAGVPKTEHQKEVEKDPRRKNRNDLALRSAACCSLASSTAGSMWRGKSRRRGRRRRRRRRRRRTRRRSARPMPSARGRARRPPWTRRRGRTRRTAT